MSITDRNSWPRFAFCYGFVFGAIGFVVSTLLMIAAINRSTSSTAAIGYIFMPFWALIYSIPAFITGFSIGYLRKVWLSEIHKFTFPIIIAGVVAVGTTGFCAHFFWNGILLSKKIHQISAMDTIELSQTLDHLDLGKNKYVLGAIAQNLQATPAILHQIAKTQDNELHRGMGSMFFDLLGNNRKGLAVMRLVARHPNVAEETLEILAGSHDEYVLADVASNKKLPEATLRKISDKGGYLIEWGISYNRKAPKDLLTKLSRSTNEDTRANVAGNPNTSAEDLIFLSLDKEWYVRGNVALNPTTSKEIVLKLTNDPDDRVKRSATERSKQIQ